MVSKKDNEIEGKKIKCIHTKIRLLSGRGKHVQQILIRKLLLWLTILNKPLKSWSKDHD